jgi:drug/metabolite transporter (DMT)-like permease
MAITLALVASLCWGVADFLGGSTSRRHPLLTVVLVSQAVGLAGVVLLALVLAGGPPAGVAPAGVAAGLCGVAAVLCFYRSMSVGAISVAAPILATSAVVPVTAGLLSGERPSTLQLAGIAAALAGVVLVSREPAAGGGTVRGQGVTLALAAALALGLQLIALDHAARADPLWAVAAARGTSVAVFALAALVVRPPVAAAVLPVLVAIGLSDTTANAAFAQATTSGYLSVVAVLASLFPLVTVALAHVHLHERLSPGQRVGVVLALAGTVAIAVG